MSVERLPRVSIAVPTYNRAELLDRALGSLRRQTFEDFEIVICDNASTDGTSDVVREHASDARIRHHRAATNVGAFKNFELGLLLARGEYFMWAADDDLWEEDLVKTLLEVLEADRSTVLACAEARYMTIEGEQLAYFPEGDALRRRPSRGPLAERLRALVNGHYGNLFYGLYQRSALIRIYRDRPVGTVFSVYGPTSVGDYGPQSGVNEVPILLQVAARGGIRVIDSCLWAKATTPNAHRDAYEESLERGNLLRRGTPPATAATLVRGIAATRWRLRSDAAYHRAVFQDVARSIRALEIPRRLKRELIARFRMRLIRHFLAFERRQAVAAAETDAST